VIGNERYLRGSRLLRRAIFHFVRNARDLTQTARERQFTVEAAVPSGRSLVKAAEAAAATDFSPVL
jgi:hypothetical protein